MLCIRLSLENVVAGANVLYVGEFCAVLSELRCVSNLTIFCVRVELSNVFIHWQFITVHCRKHFISFSIDFVDVLSATIVWIVLVNDGNNSKKCKDRHSVPE